MSFLEVFIFVGAIGVPVSIMFANDYRIARHNKMKVTALPACFNRYASLIVLTCVYGGMFYVLLLLYDNGYLDNGQQIGLYEWEDFFVPTACISTISILLFGYILQADNAFYLRSLMAKQHQSGDNMDLIYRTFRSISIGQIAPGIFYPLSVSLWALHGAWLYNIYNIVIRASNQDLIPRVFFYGSVRMMMALFVSVLIYCVFQAFLKPYKPLEHAKEHGLQVNNSKYAFLLIAVAFFSGLFPMQAAMATWQQLKSSDFFGEVFSPTPILSLEHLQGMNAWMADRLFEEGIVDVHQLATIGERRDLLHSRIENLISSRQFDDWIDQARLMLFVTDADVLKALRRIGIRGQRQLDGLFEPGRNKPRAQLMQSLDREQDKQVKRFILQYGLTHAAQPAADGGSAALSAH